MRTLKRILFFLMIVAMVVSMVACGIDEKGKEKEAKSKLDPENPTTIIVWHYYSDESGQILNSMISNFNETVGLEKGIIVKAVNKGKIIELEKSISDSAKGIVTSEPMPNIFSSYIDKAVEIDMLGKLTDLNKYFSQKEKEKYVKNFIEAGMYKGKLLIAPVVKSTEIMYVNKEAWDAAKAKYGYSDDDLKTWEGIVKVAKDYHKNKQLAGENKAFFGFDSIPNFEIIAMKQLGVDIIDGENKCANLNRGGLRRIFDIYYGQMLNEGFYSNGKFRSDNIKSSDIVAYVGSNSGGKYFPEFIVDNEMEKKISLLALNYPSFSGKNQLAMLQGAGFCVAKASDAEVEGSIEFVKWFTNEKNNFEFAIKAGYLPALVSIYESKMWKDELKSLENGDTKSKNLAEVYDKAGEQVLDKDTYYVTPFDKSYKIRIILESTLQEITNDAINRKNNLHEPIENEADFEKWLTKIKKELDKDEIKYIES